MAIKKIRMKPEGSNDFGDVLYPETTASQVLEEPNLNFMTDAEKTKLIGLDATLSNKVDNSRVLTDVPLGAKFTDTISTIASIGLTSDQIRKTIASTADPSGGNDGDIWLKYV